MKARIELDHVQLCLVSNSLSNTINVFEKAHHSDKREKDQVMAPLYRAKEEIDRAKKFLEHKPDQPIAFTEDEF